LTAEGNFKIGKARPKNQYAPKGQEILKQQFFTHTSQ
jgi:hypothetical protein